MQYQTVHTGCTADHEQAQTEAQPKRREGPHLYKSSHQPARCSHHTTCTASHRATVASPARSFCNQHEKSNSLTLAWPCRPYHVHMQRYKDATLIMKTDHICNVAAAAGPVRPIQAHHANANATCTAPHALSVRKFSTKQIVQASASSTCVQHSRHSSPARYHASCRIAHPVCQTLLPILPHCPAQVHLHPSSNRLASLASHPTPAAGAAAAVKEVCLHPMRGRCCSHHLHCCPADYCSKSCQHHSLTQGSLGTPCCLLRVHPHPQT